MKAAVLEQFQKPLVVRDVPDPKAGDRDAVVRVEANGICRSDWHAWMGDWEWIGLKPQLPRIIGHEFCGVIEEVGKEVSHFKKGDRVVVPFNHGCGNCEFCHAGHQNVCANLQLVGFHYDGGYGRLAKVPNADLNIVALPESVGFVDAASMGCRFMTSFHGVADQAKVTAGEWVAVHGCGGIGLAAINIAAALGAIVIAVDIDERKLNKAKEVGASYVVNAAREENPAAAIQELTKGGAHVSVDALGVAKTMRNSVMSLRTRGRHLQIGLTTQAEKGEVSLPTDLIVAKELTFVGSLGMQPRRFSAMLKMVESGKLKPEKLVGNTVPIEKASDVLASMGQYGTLGVTVINRW
jgi:D-arabinose 1-dehydrogenase-like Zn-dependent alcohol dehydrogenase